MRETLSSVPVLVPGKLHGHAASRIGTLFQRVIIESSNSALLSEQERARIKGVASYAKIDAAFIDALPNLKKIGRAHV